MKQILKITPSKTTPGTDGIERRVRFGYVVILSVFGGIGLWSVTASLDSAVVAPGSVQVEASRKKIQHLEGGIVKEIRVREGEKVAAGQLLIRLDDTTVGANLHLVQGQNAELAAKRYRLVAERDGANEIAFPAEAKAQARDPKLAAIIAAQQAMFEARRASRMLEIDVIRQQQEQLEAQIAGLKKQEASSLKQIGYYEDELEGVRALYSEGLTEKSRLLNLERSAESGRGELEGLAASIAGAEARLKETELEVLRLDRSFREKVIEELGAVEAELTASSYRLVGAEDQTERTEILAPRSGRVLNLAVHTIGGVIKPGDTLMEIVPEDDSLVIGVRVMPQDIDKVFPQSPAVVRLSAFNQRTTPTLTGIVQQVSADLVPDPATGRGYYQAVIAIPTAEAKLKGLALMPGMPAEVLIRTGERTPLAYLMKPLTDSFARAMRED
jgi:HlyD family type I secretion membrane fusion protein